MTALPSSPEAGAADRNRRRSESCKRAWAEGKGKLAGKKREQEPCKCGCGELASKYFDYLPGHSHRGKSRPEEWREKMAAGVAAAHARGVYVGVQRQRKDKTLERRPKCLCGCGRPVKRPEAKYATVTCVPKHGQSAQQMDEIRALRDISKLSERNSKMMRGLMADWRKSGRLDEMRRKAGNAKGMLDHLSAKAWIIRDPAGRIHRCSNLHEWARVHEHLFHDDRPYSKTPFWLRISGGIAALTGANGRSCSYRGWTAVSKLELARGGSDLLERDTKVLEVRGIYAV